MNLLCFDMGSGGISAAIFNSNLDAKRYADNQWVLETDKHGAATLSVEGTVERFKHAIRSVDVLSTDPINAICIGTFLHSCVVLDEADQPLTPVFTWLDHRGENGLKIIRTRLGDRFHEITGCRYHSMFPVFKLAAMRASDSELFSRAKRIVSIKAVLLNRLTGIWVEDHGIASASGLFDIRQGEWASELLDILGIDRKYLPRIAGRTEVIGNVTSNAAADFGLSEGIPVVAGSGDGFLANMGSDCEAPEKIAVSLGTSAVVRQTLDQAVLNSSAGTFCYKADEKTYLLGCAGSNGGNVLDWGRQVLNTAGQQEFSDDPPIFIPTLHGERSPEWNPHLRGSWHGLTARHTAADLWSSILEGVIFNLAHFVEIVQHTSGKTATDLVLSGNGFLDPNAAPVLASVTGLATWMPTTPGLASLRGAGICALRALGEPTPILTVDQVRPLTDARLLERYREYRRLRDQLSRELYHL
jgi:gluconokinase